MIEVLFLEHHERVFTLDAVGKVRAWVVDDEGLISEVPPDAALDTIQKMRDRA